MGLLIVICSLFPEHVCEQFWAGFHLLICSSSWRRRSPCSSSEHSSCWSSRFRRLAATQNSSFYVHFYKFRDTSDKLHELRISGLIYPVSHYGSKSSKKSRHASITKGRKKIRIFYKPAKPSRGITFENSGYLKSIYTSYILNKVGLTLTLISSIMFLYLCKKIYRLSFRIKQGYRDK